MTDRLRLPFTPDGLRKRFDEMDRKINDLYRRPRSERIIERPAEEAAGGGAAEVFKARATGPTTIESGNFEALTWSAAFGNTYWTDDAVTSHALGGTNWVIAAGIWSISVQVVVYLDATPSSGYAELIDGQSEYVDRIHYAAGHVANEPLTFNMTFQFDTANNYGTSLNFSIANEFDVDLEFPQGFLMAHRIEAAAVTASPE